MNFKILVDTKKSQQQINNDINKNQLDVDNNQSEWKN